MLTLYDLARGLPREYSGHCSASCPPLEAQVRTANAGRGRITVEPTSGLVTTEAGGTDTFTIVLDTQPTAPVTIDLSSSDESEGTLSAATVTFDATNWDQSQTVTVTGQNDDEEDGDALYTIVTTPAVSTDPDYAGIDAPDVAAVNLDDDSPPGPEFVGVAAITHGTSGPKGRDLLTICDVLNDLGDPVAGASVSIDISLEGSPYASTVTVAGVAAAGLAWDGDPCETTFTR